MSNGFLNYKCLSHLIFCTGLLVVTRRFHGYIHWVQRSDMALWCWLGI